MWPENPFRKPEPEPVDAKARVQHRCSLYTYISAVTSRMGRRSLHFEAPPTPVAVDDSRTINLRVSGFEEQIMSAAAVPIATIAVPANQAREANDIFRRMRRSDNRRRAEQ
jgi:hypothetical protein